MLNTNTQYQNASPERKKNLLEKVTAQQVPISMRSIYKFVDNSRNGTILTYEEAKKSGDISDESEETEKVYSKEFNGFFFKHDLAYLENYYNKLEEDFTFDNESIRDYARKVCKASLQADKVQDAYAAGKTDFSSVKDALSQFDMLSKSANFAACSRKTKKNDEITSWSETTLYLETHGHPMERKVEWEKDVVDEMIIELQHIARALNIDA